MRKPIFALMIALLACSCASSPEQTKRRAQAQQDINAILTQTSDASEYTETKRCLSAAEYRSFRALNDQYIVFEGTRDQLWINQLSIRCPDLRNAHVLSIRSISPMGRICKLDSFEPGDWFAWPWYRRSPWRWGAQWSTGASCTLGEFQAVTPAQVVALERAIKER